MEIAAALVLALAGILVIVRAARVHDRYLAMESYEYKLFLVCAAITEPVRVKQIRLPEMRQVPVPAQAK